MSNKDHWHLDDEGRLHRAMSAQNRNGSTWHGLPAATTRGARKADRLLNGIIVAVHAGIAVAVGAFALAALGYIDVPSKGSGTPVTVTQPADLAISPDLCGK
jgi:hypothetical protein